MNEFSTMIKDISGNDLDVFVDNTGNVAKIIEKDMNLLTNEEGWF